MRFWFLVLVLQCVVDSGPYWTRRLLVGGGRR